MIIKGHIFGNRLDFVNFNTRIQLLLCYGDWQFVEMQNECKDNYYYSQDLKVDYTSPANDVVNALMKLIAN